MTAEHSAEIGATPTTAGASTVQDAPTEPTLRQKLVAELLGTFILVLFGCGAAVFATIWIAGARENVDLAFITTVGLAFGLALVVGIYAFGRISGGHFNPAVSLGAAISGRISWITAGLYAAAQVVGAILGALVLWIAAHGYSGYDSTRLGLGANSFGGDNGYAWWAAFILELVMTAVFVWVILGTTDERNPYSPAAPLAIGLTLAAIHFVAIPATGTSVNPARSIGPALFSGGDAIADLWLFILAPLLGGAIAGITYPQLFGRVGTPVPGSGLALPARTRAGTTPEYAGWGQQGWGGPEGGAPVPGAGQQQGQVVGQNSGQTSQAGVQHAGQFTGEATGQHPVQPGQTQQIPADLPVIEQDGWRWDYAAQQWRPIEQPRD